MGIVILAVLALADGIFDALAGATLLGLGKAVAANTILSGDLLTLLGAILLGVALLLLALAYGLWFTRSWAWSLGVGLETANILLAFVRLAGGREAIPGVLLTLLLASTVLYYLMQRPVRALFGRS